MRRGWYGWKVTAVRPSAEPCSMLYTCTGRRVRIVVELRQMLYPAHARECDHLQSHAFYAAHVHGQAGRQAVVEVTAACQLCASRAAVHKYCRCTWAWLCVDMAECLLLILGISVGDAGSQQSICSINRRLLLAL
eukprot:1157234-Pelagomonas_calceolata.AAC.11